MPESNQRGFAGEPLGRVMFMWDFQAPSTALNGSICTRGTSMGLTQGTGSPVVVWVRMAPGNEAAPG